MNVNPGRELAMKLDDEYKSPVGPSDFFIPSIGGRDDLYLVGNSLGLLSKLARKRVEMELEKWSQQGVRGHFEGDFPWVDYHQFLTGPMAKLVGGLPDEVIVMNTLTVNLHLMMCTFYRPDKTRNAILIEKHAFPSDRQAAISQIQHHGFQPSNYLIEVEPDDQQQFHAERIAEAIRDHRDRLALVLLPGVQYYTGQVFDMKKIAQVCREYEIPLGLDLAHAVGNVPLNLHDWQVDFACWCSYKYLNSGPGSLGGCFIHRDHANNTSLPRLSGWWGHNRQGRFQMSGQFDPIPTAEGWQLSNPPILSAAAIRGSLEVFEKAGGMEKLWTRSRQQHRFFRQALKQELGDKVHVITPESDSGCQLSLEINFGEVDGKLVYEKLETAGIRTDWREPNVIRAAPVPLYNSCEQIWDFVSTLSLILKNMER
ncbi:MAG: kynureninase [Planctomycetota bacterium]